jgi:hypothetical protein
VVQLPPVARQQRLVVGAGAQEKLLSQQPGPAAPGVQASPSESPQGGRQVPDWQVVPAQHWALDVHDWPEGRQHRPLWQRS